LAEFQGDETAKRGVFGLIDDAHASATEFFDEATVRNCAAISG
jgi:hypothetical protein